MPINKSELANLIGIRRETLSRKLTKMKEDKILDYNKNKFYLEVQIIYDNIRFKKFFKKSYICDLNHIFFFLFIA